MNYLETTSFNRYSMHEGMRSTLETLWASRQPYLDFRTFRTSGFSTRGSGVWWLWMKKFNDTFVCGVRKKTNETDTPSGDFHKIWAICKPNRTYIPAFADQSRNNWFYGMGVNTLVQYTPRIPIPQNLGVYFSNDISHTLVCSGVEIDDKGLLPYGPIIQQPVVQVYDETLYKRGRQALITARRYLDLYINRHKLIDRRDSWASWGPAFINLLVAHFLESDIPPSPELMLEWYSKDFRYVMPWKTNAIAFPQQSAIHRAWVKRCLDLGICRIVPKGTPLYTESLPIIPYVPNYDQLIRAN